MVLTGKQMDSGSPTLKTKALGIHGVKRSYYKRPPPCKLSTVSTWVARPFEDLDPPKMAVFAVFLLVFLQYHNQKGYQLKRKSADPHPVTPGSPRM